MTETKPEGMTPQEAYAWDGPPEWFRGALAWAVGRRKESDLRRAERGRMLEEEERGAAWRW